MEKRTMPRRTISDNAAPRTAGRRRHVERAIALSGALLALGALAGCVDPGDESLLDDSMEGVDALGEELLAIELSEPPIPAEPVMMSIKKCIGWRAPDQPLNEPQMEWQQQGRELHGANAPEPGTYAEVPRSFSLSNIRTADGTPIQGAHVYRGRLVGQLSNEARLQWNGVYLTATLRCVDDLPELTVYAVITSVTAIDSDTVHYEVSLKDPETKNLMPACRAFGGADAVAIPFEGVWDERGDWHSTGDAFTFGCMTSAVAKCYNWGYHPWDTFTLDAPMRMRNLHQACTRMARADYCGDGRTFTMNNTPINQWDDAGVVKPGDARDGFTFEAAWTPGGVLCMDHFRKPDLRPGSCGAKPMHVCHSEAEAEAYAEALEFGADLAFNESKGY
jgi:hypothetical protein